MIIIPGFVINAVTFVIFMFTFPGIILHEIAHKFFCDRYQIPVYDVKFFAVSRNAGHVVHAVVDDSRKNAIIGLAPLFINSVVCLLLLTPELLPLATGTSFANTYTLSDIFLIWVGFSCGLNALPSQADIDHVDQSVSWSLICGKRLAQVFNCFGFFGNCLWVAALFMVPYYIFGPFFLRILQIFL